MTKPLLDALKLQAEYCRSVRAGFSAAVIEAVRANVEAGGPALDLLSSWRDADVTTLVREAVALRVLGGLHLLALRGEEPAWSAAFPGEGREGDPAALARLLPAVIEREAEPLGVALRLPPQTNEVLRSAALLGGFLSVAEETGLPLRCLEIGSSAGLNQCWDAYAYELGGAVRRGPASSAVVLKTDWRGAPPPDPPWPRVAERRGCDQAPIDLRDPAEALRLKSFVWADQASRLARLNAAVDLAVNHGVSVERSDAVDWAEAHVRPEPGTATVLFHSIVRQYLSAEGRSRLDRVVARAAAAADAAQPFAWLRMEGLPERGYEVRLTLWPDGTERFLAETHPHGEWVAWRGGAES